MYTGGIIWKKNPKCILEGLIYKYKRDGKKHGESNEKSNTCLIGGPEGLESLRKR